MESQRAFILENQETSDENLGEIHSLCGGIYEGMVNADNATQWRTKAHEADIKIHTQENQIQGLQDDLNQMCIRTNEQCKEREELRKELIELRSAVANEQAANQSVHTLTEQVENLQRMLNEKDTTIARANENLEAAQEKLRSQTRILQDREEQIHNEQEQHEIALELRFQQGKQAVTHAVDQETQELRAKNQATEKRLQEANTARAQLECELTNVRQKAEVSGKRNVEDLHQIRGEIAAVIALVTELTTRLEESEGERKGVQGSLQDWSRQRADIGQIQHMLGRLARDQPNAIQMSDQLKEVLEIQKKVAGILEYHQPVLTSPAARVIPSQEQQHQNFAAHSQEKSQNPKRKVMVKSPVNGDDHLPPLSIEEERSTRRQSAPPRGIMKAVPHSTSREQEADEKAANIDTATPVVPQATPKRRIANRGSKIPLTTHSMYNRPVAGSVLETNMEQFDSSQASSNGYKSEAALDGTTSGPGNSNGAANSLYDIIETDNTEGPARKRQRIIEAGQQRNQELHGAKKIKLSRSMSAPFPAQQPEGSEPSEELPSKSKTFSLRGGPIERKPSGLLTYSSQSSATKRSHSQSFIAFNAEILPL
ncbi:hypothetical protein F5Y06DRAFT_286153 [Hypoxylon sp. FL0890]|nr:hypothetical protein F5Y06DRAFT_286153 [Hypoxylon sp. FL0890]